MRGPESASSPEPESSMTRNPSHPPAAESARWLSQLADVLEEAHDLLGDLGHEFAQQPCAADLYVRLAAVRGQLHRLRLDRTHGQADPDRSIPPPWPLSDVEGR